MTFIMKIFQWCHSYTFFGFGSQKYASDFLTLSYYLVKKNSNISNKTMRKIIFVSFGAIRGVPRYPEKFMGESDILWHSLFHQKIINTSWISAFPYKFCRVLLGLRLPRPCSKVLTLFYALLCSYKGMFL